MRAFQTNSESAMSLDLIDVLVGRCSISVNTLNTRCCLWMCLVSQRLKVTHLVAVNRTKRFF